MEVGNLWQFFFERQHDGRGHEAVLSIHMVEIAAMSHPNRRRAVILHGKPDEDEYFGGVHPSASNSHWIPWLQKQLLVRGYDAQTPEVVDAYKPKYILWSAEFERHVVDEPMVLAGHSCGAGFLVRWLSEHPDVRVDTLALVAPWLDPQRTDTTDFFDFNYDDMGHFCFDDMKTDQFPDLLAAIG